VKYTAIAIIAAFSGFSLVGCASLNPKLAHSDGLVGFVMSLGGHEHRDAFPIKLTSGASGRPATGHVLKDAHGIYVWGYVEKLGPGSVTAAWSHIDIVVLDSKNQPLQKITTRFAPAEIPASQRGIAGRSRYFVQLPSVPPPDSSIEITFHAQALPLCDVAPKS
jgi:hypothetical protein